MSVKLSKKAKGFARDYAITGNGTQSALKNYDTNDYKTASVIATENLDKPSIIEEIARIEKSLADRIPDDLLEEKHKALLNKLEVKRTFNQEIGEWIEIETGQIDTIAVSKGLDMAYKLKGSYAPDKVVSVNVEIEASDEIRELAKQLNEMNRSKS